MRYTIGYAYTDDRCVRQEGIFYCGTLVEVNGFCDMVKHKLGTCSCDIGKKPEWAEYDEKQTADWRRQRAAAFPDSHIDFSKKG